MIQDMSNLPDWISNHTCTLRKASKDDANEEIMCNSEIRVVDFDKIPKEYSRDLSLSNMPCSNDALYIKDRENWYFIEFKNGSLDKSQIYRKIYDSLIMLIDKNVIPSFDFSRKYIKYILVYNPEKYQKTNKSENREKIYSHIFKLSKKEEKILGIENFEKYLFKEVHSYTKEMFQQEFINAICI